MNVLDTKLIESSFAADKLQQDRHEYGREVLWRPVRKEPKWPSSYRVL